MAPDMLSAPFSQLGLTDKHQRIYLALVEAGRMSATQLSKRTSIPRATLYALLEQLINHGVIAKEHTRRTAMFMVNDPQSFVRMVERERESLEVKEKAAFELAQSIGPLLSAGRYPVAKIQVFEGRQSIENMLYDFLPLWRRSIAASDNTLWGFQDQTFVETYARWHKFLWDTMPPREEIRLFSNHTDVEKELQHRIPNREVRPLPAGVHFRSSMWIYGEYIVMGITRQEPNYCIQMKDELLASNIRTIFQLLWSAQLGSPAALTRRANG